MEMVFHSEKSVLLEDIEGSDIYRLGVEADLNDIGVAAGVARWYRQLHQSGEAFVRVHGDDLYDENDIISLENIEIIKTKTSTQSNPVWAEIEENLDVILSIVKAAKRTLTYNDFYYTNMVVRKDKSEAFMFDYNLLGKGYAYADIRNVCSVLGESARRVFLDEYGGFDEFEVLVDNVAATIITLYFACKLKKFPQWAMQYLQSLEDGFSEKVRDLLRGAK